MQIQKVLIHTNNSIMTFCLLQIALFEPNVKTFSHHYLSVSLGAWNKGRWANNLQGHFLRHGNITPSCHIWLRLTNLYLSPNKNKKKNVFALTLNRHVVWNPDTQIKQKVYSQGNEVPSVFTNYTKTAWSKCFHAHESKCTSTTPTTAHPLSNIKL